MRVWTTVKLLFVLVVLLIIALVAEDNKNILGQDFRLVGDYRLPVFMILFLSFALGLFVSIVLTGIYEIESFMKRRRVRKATKELTKADMLYNAGVGALIKKQCSAALEALEKSLALNPSSNAAVLRLSQTLVQLGKYEDAIKRVKKLLNQMDEREDENLYCEARITLGEALIQTERYEEAIGILHRAMKDCEERSFEISPILLEVYIKTDDWEKAQDIYEDMKKEAKEKNLPAPPDEYERTIPYRKALARIKDNEPRSAERTLKRLIKAHPDFIPAYTELGKLYADTDREDDAIETWSEGLKATGSFVFLPLMEEYFLEQLEQPDKALDVFRSIAQTAQNDILPRFLLGKLYYRLEMMDEAYEQFRSIEPRISQSPTIHYFLGKVKERRGRAQEATENYKRAIRESKALDLQYSCIKCETKYGSWEPQCSACKRYGTIDIDIRAELSPTEIGLATAPVYSAITT